MTKGSLYAALGVDPDADPDTIRRAHRRRAKEHHPDAGGDREAFERVQGAWLVLRDPAKRERYDRTGETEEPRDERLEVIAGHIMGAFDAAVSQAGPMLERSDLIKATKGLMLGKKVELMRQRDAIAADLAAAKRLLKRIRFKRREGFDPIGHTMRERIAAAERSLPLADAEIATFVEAITYLDCYGFDFDRPTPATSPADFFTLRIDNFR